MIIWHSNSINNYIVHIIIFIIILTIFNNYDPHPVTPEHSAPYLLQFHSHKGYEHVKTQWKIKHSSNTNW